jgi:hypothetical protein
MHNQVIHKLTNKTTTSMIKITSFKIYICNPNEILLSNAEERITNTTDKK